MLHPHPVLGSTHGGNFAKQNTHHPPLEHYGEIRQHGFNSKLVLKTCENLKTFIRFKSKGLHFWTFFTSILHCS
jgi:hypothetical protein